MKFDLTVLKNVMYMDSRDIAELTEKKHLHVLRDIRSMLEDLGEDMSGNGDSHRGHKTAFSSSDGDLRKSKNGFSYFIKSYTVEGNFRKYLYYLLDYELTLTLLTGYSVKLRNTVIKRWIALEKDYKNKRAKSIDVRNHFTDTLREHGYTKAHHYIQTTIQMKRSLGIENKKENMTSKEIQAVKASEALAELLLDDEMGYGEVNPVCVGAADIVANAKRKRLQA